MIDIFILIFILHKVGFDDLDIRPYVEPDESTSVAIHCYYQYNRITTIHLYSNSPTYRLDNIRGQRPSIENRCISNLQNDLKDLITSMKRNHEIG